MGTAITALILGGIVFLAARSVWKNKKAGKCCGCSGCSGKCSGQDNTID